MTKNGTGIVTRYDKMAGGGPAQFPTPSVMLAPMLISFFPLFYLPQTR